jgi:predicted HTH domain antitoxin
MPVTYPLDTKEVVMALKKAQVELPEELWALAGISPAKASAQLQELLVMELLRHGKLSQGRAAELLGVDRWALMEVMAAHEVPATQLTADELAEEQQRLHKFLKDKP